MVLIAVMATPSMTIVVATAGSGLDAPAQHCCWMFSPRGQVLHRSKWEVQTNVNNDSE